MPSSATCRVVLVLLLLVLPIGAALGIDKGAAGAELQKALGSGQPEAVDEVLKALLRAGGQDAMEVILGAAERIPAGFDIPYWQLLTAATSFVDRPGLGRLGDYVKKKAKQAIARDLLFGLRKNLHDNTVLAVAPVFRDGPDDLREMALDRLAGIRSVEAMDVLIEVLASSERKDPAFHAFLRTAMITLVGEDMGDTANWTGWWSANRKHGFPKTKAGHGGTGTVVDGLDPVHVSEFERLKRCPGRIICLQVENCGRGGCGFDAIEFILRRMGLHREVVDRADFERPDYDMRGVMAVMLNCVQMNEHCVCPTCKASKGPKSNRLSQCEGCDRHVIRSHRLSDGAVKRLKDFVEAGGYIFSEDWALKDFLARAWPDKVKVGASLSFMDATAILARGAASHPLLRGVFEEPDIPDVEGEGPDPTDVPEEDHDDTIVPEAPEPETFRPEHTWHIDDESPAISIQSRDVLVLLVSPDLRAKAKGDEALAITFRAGRAQPDPDVGADGGPITGPRRRRAGELAPGGRVLHVMSHFGKQGSDLDEFALQSMLINFLGEAACRWPEQGE